MARGPFQHAKRHKACIVNGFRFRTKSHEAARTTQNSGVLLRASTVIFASARDNNPCTGQVTYYGVLQDILKIRYSNDVQYILFKCDWVDNERGRMQDEFNFTLVNFNSLMYKENNLADEPFILSTQAEQVWYVADPIDPNWNVAVRMNRRDNFDVYSRFHDADPCPPQSLDDRPVVRDEDVGWVREGVEPIAVDVSNDIVGESHIDEDED